MSEVAPTSNWIHRVTYTPMRDVLCGRFTGRLDVRQRIAQSGLPQSARELIQRVVHRTRLRSLEKADVANELLAHFADGLEAGKTIEELIHSFGDERQAAKLIARAKRRNRSIFGRAQTLVARSVIAAIPLIVLYALIGLYFFSSKPSGEIPVDALNRNARDFPEDQRAWPLYLKAVEQSSHLDRAAATMRQAATKPVLGYTIPPGNVDESAVTVDGGGFPDDNSPYEGLGFWISPALAFLQLDAANAAKEHNPDDRLVRDIAAIDQIVWQWHKDPSFDSVDWPLQEELHLVDRTLAQTPDLFSDADLANLKTQLGAYRNAADLLNLENQQIKFQFWLNTHFTTGRFGFGRITPVGLSDVIGYSWVTANPFWRPLVQPALFLVVPSRATVQKEFNDEIERCRSKLDVPYRLADWKIQDYENQSDDLLSRLRLRTKVYATVRDDAKHAEDELGRRDGLHIGIALEQYHRQYKAYPASLVQLMPAFLNEIPADRVTGDPVHYRIVNGKPLVYSVGQDRKDDGGRPHFWRDGLPAWELAADLNVDGDWVLYPVASKE